MVQSKTLLELRLDGGAVLTCMLLLLTLELPLQENLVMLLGECTSTHLVVHRALKGRLVN